MPSLVRAEAFHTLCCGDIAAQPAAVLDPEISRTISNLD